MLPQHHSTVEELMQMAQQHPTSSPIMEPYQHSVPSSFIDVHRFDYSYANQTHEAVPFTNDQRIDWIRRLEDRMSHPLAKRGAEIIRANIGHDANRDNTNQKTADDLLVLLSQHVIERDAEFLPLVEEQLVDMVELGQCAQGRTTRLWQLYISLPSRS